MPKSTKDIKQTTCLQCGKRFNAWRAKQYCSEVCRKNAQNVRLGYVRRSGEASGTTLADAEIPSSEAIDIVNKKNPFRRDEGFEWTACNEITRKLTRKGSSQVVAWLMQIAGRGWYGRIGKDASGQEFSFGPATATRAMQAVEARLMGRDFEKNEGEHSWNGDCWDLVVTASRSSRAEIVPAEARLPAEPATE